MGRGRLLGEGSATTSARFVSFYKNRNGATPEQIAAIEARQRARATRLRRIAIPIEVGEEPKPFAKALKKRSTSPRYLVFRECLLRHITTTPRVGFLIRQDLSNDYGSHTERRFWRVLSHLMDERIVEKTVDGYRLRQNAQAGGGA